MHGYSAPAADCAEIGRGQEKKIQKTIDSFKRAACFLADAAGELL